ncbi:MAG TPA: hypothetical protein VGL56_15465 [Fimbriimonadaceae bacterium]|jgi:hypothetical protein
MEPVYPSQYPATVVPSTSYELGGGRSLLPGTRVKLNELNQQSCFDSICLEGEWSKEDIESWLIFHAFTVNDRTPISHYESGGYLYRLELLDEQPLGKSDFEDLLPNAFFTLDLAQPRSKISYLELFERFQRLGADKLSLIKTSLLNFGIGGRSRTLIDGTYWKLASSFSIVDHIVGQQSACSGTCTTCGHKVWHNPVSAKEWLCSRIKEIVGEGPICDSYCQVIWDVRQKIRHSTVHDGIHPTAKLPEFQEGIKHYPLEALLESYQTERVALLALSGKASDIARNLLIEYAFGLGIFPRLTRSYTVGASFTIPANSTVAIDLLNPQNNP